MKRSVLLSAILATCVLGTPVRAQDGEVWLNPRASKALQEGFSIELETAQRFRQAPREDTIFFRLWVNKAIDDGPKVSLGVEQRFNGPDEEEVRFLQQIGYDLGPIAMRTRFEQRDVSTDDRLGLRVRQRIGASFPLTAQDRGWSLAGEAEAFVTLRSTSVGGDTGLTGLRTFVGFERPVGVADLSIGYLRQQDIRPGPDRIGHAPFLGINLSF